MRPTRKIIETLFPIATVEQMAMGGHLQKRFEMYRKNYLRAWTDAHAENAERDSRVNKVSAIRKVAK